MNYPKNAEYWFTTTVYDPESDTDYEHQAEFYVDIDNEVHLFEVNTTKGFSETSKRSFINQGEDYWADHFMEYYEYA